MEWSKRSSTKFRFKLPVYLELVTDAQSCKISSDGLLSIQRYLASDITLLNKNLQIAKKLPCVCVSDITVQNDVLIFGFIVESKKELQEFFAILQSGELSNTFTEYAEENGAELQAGFERSTKIKCHIVMDQETFKNGEEYFSGGSNISVKEPNLRGERGKMVDTGLKVKEFKHRCPLSDQNGSSDLQVLKVEVLVPLPKLPLNKFYSSVNIKLIDQNISKEEHVYKMEALKYDLWKADISVPATSHKEHISYQFTVEIATVGFGFKFTRQDSATYKMGTSNVVRQFFDRNEIHPVLCVSHLKDIIQRYSEISSLAECAIQIEDLLRWIEFNKEAGSNIFNMLLNTIDKKAKNQLLLSIVVFGNVFKNYLLVADTVLKQEWPLILLNGLENFKISDLSSSCSTYLFRVVDALSRVALGAQFCFLSFMSIAYPFFGEKLFSEKLIDIVRRKETLVIENCLEATEGRIITLFKKVCVRIDCDDAKRLLEQLIRNIPVGLALKIFKILQNEESNNFLKGGVHKLFYESLLGSVRCSISKLNLAELIHLMRVTEEVQGLTEATKESIETAVINIIQKGNQGHLEELKKVILKSNLFVSVKSQLSLIKSLMLVRFTDYQFVLFDILLDTKFSEATRVIDRDGFYDCFDNAMSVLKRKGTDEGNLKNVYVYLSKAHEVCSAQNSKELLEYIDKIAVEYLKVYELRKLMRMAKVVEELAQKDDTVGDLFKTHIQTILHEQYESSYIDALMDLCGTFGKLRINSGVTASIVTSVVNICMPNTSQLLEEFKEIILQTELWTAILKATGKEVHQVKESNNFQRVCLILMEMLKRLQDGEIPYGYLEDLTCKVKIENIISMFLLVVKVSKTDIMRYWNQSLLSFKRETEKIACCFEVVKEIQPNIENELIPVAISAISLKLNALKNDILSGKISAKQLNNEKFIWYDLKGLPEQCAFLKTYVKSDIFWNSCGAVVRSSFEEGRVILAKEQIEKEPFESIHRLFGENVENIRQKDRAFCEFMLLLEVLIEKGIEEYKKAWMSLMKEHNRDVGYALTLLNTVDVHKEIRFAEDNLREPVPDCVKNTLSRLKHIDKYERLVDTLCKVLDVFGIPKESSKEINDAISTFENIKERHMTCKFSAVVTALEKIDSFASELLPETIEILNVLGSSSSLIEFLKKIVDEDIRNLIDAVEDISEQHVQESTVSALIEVKSFLHGLLIRTGKELNAQSFLELINKQAKATSSSKIPAKIDECMNSLHNLMSLYGNVANRGEMTAEIIGNIISRGKFKFQIEDGICDFHVTYKHGSVREKQTKHSLVDLRSRALLLMNTRTKAQDRKIRGVDLEKFVSYIDLSIEISELLSELHQSGDISFLSYSTSRDCDSLKALHEQLHQTKEGWYHVLKKLREQYYLLNFIHGPEIHLLYNCFEKNVDYEKVTTLLHFIHPDLKLECLLNSYNALKGAEKKVSKEDMLQYFGRVLHHGYEGKRPLERPLCLTVHSKRLTEIVQNKHLFVVALEENSNQVVKTLLSLYLNTTQTLPEPYQALFCTKDTTWNELELLIYRCLGSFEFTRIRQLFCIANVELLPNELQFKLVEKLKNIDTKGNFLLTLICRGSGKHPFLDELSTATNNSSSMLSDEQLRQVFQTQCPGVVTYTSSVPGLGKTSRIKETAFASGKSVVNLHISGTLHRKTIIKRLGSVRLKGHNALHIDLTSVDNIVELDTFIFELIILRYVSARFKSFSLGTDMIYIEVANTINDTLRKSLNTVMAFKRRHLIWENYDNFLVSMEINSPIQVVCQYLNYLRNDTIDSEDIHLEQNSVVSLQPDKCRNLLRQYLGTDDNLSFTIVNIFLHVLAEQLKKMSCSSFFRVSRIADMVGHKIVPTVRSTLVRALIEASKEFASRSVRSCRSTQLSTVETNQLPEAEVALLSCKGDFAKVVKQRVDGMIRWEDSNHLIYVFHSQNVQTISPMYRDLEMVPSVVRSLFESQMKRRMQDFNRMNQNELLELLQKISRQIPAPIPEHIVKQFNAEYALTPDNLLKMVLIMLRISAHIPVIVMGETGCGKTSLIRNLAKVSDIEFEVLSIHAGVEEEKIIETINNSNKLAFISPEKKHWLFLDEINTSEHIGLIADAICGKTCLGNTLAPSLTVMGACNPYKLRTESAISTAGLKGKVQTDELSKLVYRVLPLPERLVDYVWDFGTLSDKDESVYIRRIIVDIFPHDDLTSKLLQDLLSASQMFVRKQDAVGYCVSLRDIQRCKILIRWFLDILPKQDRPDNNFKISAIIFALSICYHSRLSSNTQRTSYRKELQSVFTRHGINDLDEEKIKRKIVEEQKDILGRMDLPAGTAKNTALQENVFVLLVCLLNKIPIFLVGKPGCSKSLSMQVIRSNLRGKDSKDVFFRTLPQLYCVSFQGSETSTSDGIIKVFEKAARYQKSNNAEEVLSVVILDEIGLAEISRFNPLKVLHSLLEPDGRLQPDVAVVGISNWALDASKMNRAIHLSRPDMDEDELFQTGVSISESFIASTQPFTESTFRFSVSRTPALGMKAKELLKGIARSYLKYVNSLTFKNFHGLRDYYSLVKFVSRGFLSDTSSQGATEKDKIVFEGLQRNFGGLPAESATLLSMFQIQAKSGDLDATNVLKLMEENVNDRLARHLMCITSGDSALSLVENMLTTMKRDEKVVIFGSHFEEDQTADYSYRILSRIILCMEQGFVLILKDLENIYGSLYDMLNQNYTVIGKKKHCRVALGHYSNPICHVHDDFRCIVLVDESKVDYSDPPFLNRFEKQYLRFTDTIDKKEIVLIEELNNWLKQFSNSEDNSFNERDCFPIYSPDMIPSLVMKTRQTNCADKNTFTEVLKTCKSQLLHIVQSDAVFRLEKNAFNEMRRNAKKINDEFLKLPIHSGIWKFIEHQLNNHNDEETDLLTVVFTNSSIHSRSVYNKKKYDVQVEKLGAFKSEKQLHLRIQYFMKEASENFLFLHCSAAEDEKHISLAKATIDNIRAEVLRVKRKLGKHVYLIIHLDRRRADIRAVIPINYLSGWELVTMDSIADPEIPLPELSKLSLVEAVQRKKPLTRYITEQLFWSFSRIRYQKHGRDLLSIQKVIAKIQESKELLYVTEELLSDWINNEFSGRSEREWLKDIAHNSYAINTCSSFLLAIEQKLLSVIKEPLCKLIYQMENLNVIACFFGEDESKDRKMTLLRMLQDTSFFSISNVHIESGPECYTCTAIDLPFRMPFSWLLFNKVEDTKEDFMETYYKVREKCELDDDDKMPSEVLEMLFSKHEGLIGQALSDFSSYSYESLSGDYFHDFCYFVAYETSSKMALTKKYQIMRWSLEHEVTLQTNNPIELIVKLHASYWMFSSAFTAGYALFETCSEIVSVDEQFFQSLCCKSSETSERKQKEESERILVNKNEKLEVSNTKCSVSSDNGINVADGTCFRGAEQSLTPETAFEKIQIKDQATDEVLICEKNSHYLPEDRASPKVVKRKGSVDIEAKYNPHTVQDSAFKKYDVEVDAKCTIIYSRDKIKKTEYYNENRTADSFTGFNLDICFNQVRNNNECLVGKATEQSTRRSLEQETNDSVDINKHAFPTMYSSDRSEVKGGQTDSENVSVEYANNSCTTDVQLSVNEVIHSAKYNKEMFGKDIDSRKELVKFVSAKLLPTEKTLDAFLSVGEWNKRVSTVLTHAVQITSDSSALHSLRFCYDLISILDTRLQNIKWKNVITIGNMLQAAPDGNPILDSYECFQSVCNLIFSEPKLPLKVAQYVLSSYLNRCIAANEDTEAVIHFLHMPSDIIFMDSNFDVFKPPLQLALNLATVEDEDVFFNLINSTDDEEILVKYPFLMALDESFKAMDGTVTMDSQFSVLIVDILEEMFSRKIKDMLSADADETKSALLYVHNVILSYCFGLKFLSALSFYKSFIHNFVHLLRLGDFDTTDSIMFVQVVKAVVDKESDTPISVSMKRYFIKELGKGMLPWTFDKKCNMLVETFAFLKSWERRENYLSQCVEGNPIFLCAPQEIGSLQRLFEEGDYETQCVQLQEFFKNCNNGPGLLAMHAVCLSRFFIQRSYKQQDDTCNQIAAFLIKTAEQEKVDHANLQFLACILGAQIFPSLDLNEQSDEIHTACSIFSCSLLAMLLVSNQMSAEDNNLSFLGKVLFRPARVDPEVMTLLLISFKRNRENHVNSENRENILFSCSCGYRLAAAPRNTEDDLFCPICSNDINKIFQKSEELKSRYRSRQSTQNKSVYANQFHIIDTIAQTVIDLCIRACLLGSLSLNLATVDDLKQTTGLSEIDDIPNTLMNRLYKDFTTLQSLLTMNCRNTYIFLQACLLSLKGFLCEDKSSISTKEQVSQWSKNFFLQIVSLIKDRYGTVIHIVEEQSKAQRISNKGHELSVHENDTNSLVLEERIQFLPSLFREQGKGHRTSFMLELHALKEGADHPYPFLLYVLDVLPDLELTEHLLTIVRWHITAASQIECRMRKRQCLEMTVEDFIHYDMNETMRKRLQDRFESLQMALTLLTDDGHGFGVNISRITSQTKMKDCLILDSTSVLFNVIKCLCEIQNTFLDASLEFSVNNKCLALQFLSKGDGISAIPITSIVDTKASSVVSYSWDEELLTFSHADLRYGYGAQIIYEFGAIEKMLALKLVAGKSYISLENSLPSLVFIDEFYKGYGKMASEVSNIIPQVFLSSDIVQGIRNRRDQHPRLTVELITHVGILISLVKKTKGDPEMPIIEYIEIWKPVFTSPMPSNLLPVPENSVKLCHLIALYGLLEELNADSLIDSLRDEYRKPISFEIQNQLNSLLKLNKKMAETILKATKRFVYRCLSAEDADTNQPLFEYLADSSFWPTDVSLPSDGATSDVCQKSPLDYIPKDLKVHHVFKMVAYLGSKLEDLSENDVKLDKIAASFGSFGNISTVEKKRKLARKRVV